MVTQRLACSGGPHCWSGVHSSYKSSVTLGVLIGLRHDATWEGTSLARYHVSKDLFIGSTSSHLCNVAGSCRFLSKSVTEQVCLGRGRWEMVGGRVLPAEILWWGVQGSLVWMGPWRQCKSVRATHH